MASLLSGKNITISDIVVKSIIEYSKYGEIIIESKITEGQNHFNVRPVKEPVNESDEEYPGDVLMRKICKEQW